jgi:Domain of unknown function (DUF4190)
MSDPPPGRDQGLPWGPPSRPPPRGPGMPVPVAPYSWAPTNRKAQAALWSGVGLLLLACCGAGVFGVVPVVLGVVARGEIRDGGGRETGAGMALAGIVLGALAAVVTVVVVLLVVLVLHRMATIDGSNPGSV